MMIMFTRNDVEMRTIFVINCIKDRNLHVKNGELFLEEAESGKSLTKIPFQKVLALFVIGHIHISTPLIEKCRKYNVTLVVMKPNLRPVFYWSSSAEANYLLRQKQYGFGKDDLSVAKILVANKTENQLRLLLKTRAKDELTLSACELCQKSLEMIAVSDYNSLLGIEGAAAKNFFAAYFQQLDWMGRKPRAKTDPINVALDIGYTILFNFIECFVRMFGFDIYIGVYHRLWFKRKSLICDLQEPFRCIIDHQIRTSFNKNQFKVSDFKLFKNEYVLKPEKCADYYKIFFEALIPYKIQIFKYMQSYYRSFMKGRNPDNYPKFII